MLQLSPVSHICLRRESALRPCARRYSCSMKRQSLFALIWFCAASAVAQPTQTASGLERQDMREQRRAELRTALQANRAANRQSELRGGADQATPAVRHLSPGERFEMRQQLRQDQAENSRKPRS